MKLWKAIVADDEPLLCDELQCMLESSGEVEVVGISRTGEDVPALAARCGADVVFLDIQMPGMDGMAVARALASRPKPPLIVFVTAFSQFALDAFGVDAVDYILKPFDERDIDRVLRKLRQRRQGQPGHAQRTDTRKILGEAGDRLEVVDVGSVLLFQAEDRQVYMRTVDNKVFEVKHRLSELELMLSPAEFFRCHRNYIVNVNQVQQIANWFNRGYLLILRGNAAEIPVGRAFVGKLKQYFPL